MSLPSSMAADFVPCDRLLQRPILTEISFNDDFQLFHYVKETVKVPFF